MPPRKWHLKTKLGCRQCKLKRIKCDRMRPVCGNCVRSSAACSYSVGDGDAVTRTPPTTSSPSAEQSPNTYKRKWHQKSREGCLKCRERRVKCDESVPTCMRCSRIGASCVYPQAATPGQLSVVSSASSPSIPSIPARMFLARMPDAAESMAFEYFFCNCLPMLQICQPSGLWRSVFAFSSQAYGTIRQLGIALGFQQRLMEIKTLSTFAPPSKDAYLQADVFYGKCIASLRTMIDTVSPDDTPIVGLCCVLLVMLEGLRGSPKTVLMHLNQSVGIVSDLAHRSSIQKSDDIRDIVSLLQHLCVSAWMSITSPSYDGDYTLILQDIPFDKICYHDASNLQRPHSLEIHSIVGELIYTIRRMMHPNATAQERSTLFGHLYHLRARARFFRFNLISAHPKTPGRSFLEAKAIITCIYLDAILVKPRNVTAEKAAYWQILDLLDEAVTELKGMRTRQAEFAGPYPFSVGTGSLYILENILRNSHDDAIEFRALEILQQCPPREGLWTAGRILRSYFANKCAWEVQRPVARLTLASNATDHLTTPEDTIALATNMMEGLRIEG